MTFKILVTNDDGINAPGLVIAEKIAHDISGKNGTVVTVAPSLDQSGVGHSISYLRPSLITKHNDTRYSVEGSPSDCVLAGIHYVMKDNKPDLILSGVNKGHNVAEDILYSGTVGAAMEGALQGVKSIALSQCYSKDSLLFHDSFETVRNISAKICLKLITLDKWNLKPYETFYNINFPPVRNSEIRGICVCKQGRRSNSSFGLDSITSPNGRTFLMVNHTPKNSSNKETGRFKSDLEKMSNNFVTVTPLKADLTEYDELEKLDKIFKNDS
ncbi:MAG: 5'/3'-nucleotidase SurE [Paracoccaceae bacterium]|nr:5'/3'-nucleotidase SurE [Paracoccaceae bacterium]